MSNIYRLKQNFTAGEVSPLMEDRTDFERYKNGCKVLKNMVVRTQGPCSRRSGFKFIHSLNDLGLDEANPKVRMEEFIFNELQAYSLVFFEHDSGVVRVVFATGEGLVVGTGASVPYDIWSKIIYEGVGEYTATYPADATNNSIEVSHTSEDGLTTTDLVETTDYTVAYLDGVATIDVINAAITDGTLEVTLNVSSPIVPVDEVVYIDMPAGFDIDGFDNAQSGDYLYIAQTALPVHALVRHGDDAWEVREIGITAPPVEWNTTNGYPETVTMFQQRLALGGNKLRRQTIWLSQAGDFHNFSKNSPLLDSDAVTFTLDSGTQNNIQWMQAVKSLHVGTLGNEWTVSGGSLNSVTPSNVLAQRQTNNGSERVKPLMVGLTTLFVERFARIVNEFIYDYSYDGHKTSDVTILAPHLTEHTSIKDWAYQQTPDSIIWCTMDDGTMIALTYQRQHKVLGWHRHDTQGSFVTISSIPGDNREDEVWVVVKRVIEGADKYYIEKKAVQFKSDDPIDARFLDSYGVYDGVPTDTVTGLEYLEGREVDVLVDGAVHPPVTVEGGQIVLDYEASLVVVGLQFESEVRPNLAEIPMKDGTSLMRVSRSVELYVSLYNSMGMVVGQYTPENGEKIRDIPFRVPGDITGQAVPLFTGTKRIDFFPGFSRDDEYFLRQNLPLPFTVTGVVDKVEVN